MSVENKASKCFFWSSLAPSSFPGFRDGSILSSGKCMKGSWSVPPHQHGAGVPINEQKLRGWKGQWLWMKSYSRT